MQSGVETKFDFIFKLTCKTIIEFLGVFAYGMIMYCQHTYIQKTNDFNFVEHFKTLC